MCTHDPGCIDIIAEFKSVRRIQKTQCFSGAIASKGQHSIRCAVVLIDSEVCIRGDIAGRIERTVHGCCTIERRRSLHNQIAGGSQRGSSLQKRPRYRIGEGKHSTTQLDTLSCLVGGGSILIRGPHKLASAVRFQYLSGRGPVAVRERVRNTIDLQS